MNTLRYSVQVKKETSPPESLFVLPLCPSPGTISMKHPIRGVEILVLETNFAYFLCIIDVTVIQENFQNFNL